METIGIVLSQLFDSFIIFDRGLMLSEYVPGSTPVVVGIGIVRLHLYGPVIILDRARPHVARNGSWRRPC